MYRSFLSWRYLRHRPTNLIGMVGIFVAVGALILILSIMTGFLEETRRAIRGGLADLLIEPFDPGGATQEHPAGILEVLADKPEVVGATAQQRYGALLSLTGRGAEFSAELAQNSSYSKLSMIEVVGVDVRTSDRVLQFALQQARPLFAGVIPWPRIHDEVTTTEFLESLLRVHRERDETIVEGGVSSLTPVPNPLMPFVGRATRGVEESLSGPRPYPGLVIGSALAYQLSLRRGEVVQLATAIPGASDSGDLIVNNREFVITGMFESSENEVNLGRVYVERAQLCDLMGNTSVFSQVLVTLRDYEADGERVRDELRTELLDRGLIRGNLAGTEVRTWEEFRGNLLGAIENERFLMGIMLSLVMVVAGFTVFAILSMMVTEKRRDIGILCALGATRGGVLWTFLWIAFWDALIGATLGAVFGVWAALRIDDIEQWLSRVLGVQIFNRDVYLFDHIPTVVIPSAVAIIVLGAFFCALLFAAIPAWRAARLDPLEALRYE